MPLITITDSIGTNGNAIAQIVAERLGVGLFDDKRLQAIVHKTGTSAGLEHRFDQQAPGFWDRLLSREPQVYLENNIDISTLNVAVSESGTADITGVTVSQEEKNRIPEIVKKVNDISQVNADLSVWIYPL